MSKILIDRNYVIPNEESRIREVEKMIQAKLPDDYRTYLLNNNGGRPFVEGYNERGVFVRLQWPEGEPARACGELADLNEPGLLLENWEDWSIQMANDLRWIITNVEGIPQDTLAIWTDSGANPFLLGIHKHNYGKVFYQARAYGRFDNNDNATHDGIAFVSNSFTEFIQMIEPDPDDIEEWRAAGMPHLPLGLKSDSKQ
jgi:hypothetical protein